MEARNPTDESRETMAKIMKARTIKNDGEVVKKYEIQRQKDAEMRNKM